ncbi:MAG TPA: carboxypeptidase-like regulatory domain-containing protein [Kofleriaceae bacterium]|nr:carboxypeptidase-like regulatory domain-containing protein [Kofleriaceae bacterium]
MKPRFFAVIAAVVAILWWVTRGGDSHAPAPASSTANEPAAPGFTRPIRRLADGSWGARTFALPGHGSSDDGLVHARGRVLDAHDSAPIADVAVVFSGAGGETETITAADGSYDIAIAPGAYHAFVRGDGVLSVATTPAERLPGGPTIDDIGAPQPELAPLVAIARDTAGVDLAVERGAIVTGRVTDESGHPIAHALVSAHGDDRPILGGDVAETDASGAYQLVLPMGAYELEASHPDYAGLSSGVTELDLLPGTKETSMDLEMTLGCIVRGHVVDRNGDPAGDGAMEARAVGSDQFAPLGRIDPDGAFRFTSMGAVAIELRAWPWKSPPSQAQTFRCTPGARFDADFTIPDGNADLDGTIRTADGRPAAGAFLDVIGTSEGTQSQQERASIDGSWAVYDMPAGDYVVTATVPGEGSVTKQLHVPAHGVALALAGTGTIDGTVVGVADGALEMEIGRCDDQPATVYAAPETRIVPVHDGRFRIDRVPACSLYISTSHEGRGAGEQVKVAASTETPVTIDLTPPRTVTIEGRVLGADGKPAAGAIVRALNDSGMTETTAGSDGGYRLKAEVGSEVVAMQEQDMTMTDVPTTAPDDYHVDLRLDHADPEIGVDVDPQL